MVERTEEQKITQEVLEVKLGGKKFDIKPLVIRDSREWRKKVAEAISSLSSFSSMTEVTSDRPEEFKAALSSLLVSTPDLVEDLFFGYARELNREEIEKIATEAELAQAFKEVVDYAYPLALTQMMVQSVKQITTR